MTAYFMGRITVTDPQAYQDYARQTVASAERYGGRFLVKGGPQILLEGEAPERHVIIEFPDRQTALDWYSSADYRNILPLALSASQRDIVIVDGI